MSDELGEAGKLISLKETTTNCPPGTHCFDVKFEKRAYVEHMTLDENGRSKAGTTSRLRRRKPISVTIADVRAAAKLLDGVAHRTPVVRSRTLDERCGASVFVKCENLQRMGAFKFRGAYNFLSTIPHDRRANGVVAFSSGNHAQGVALAARDARHSGDDRNAERRPRSQARRDARVRRRSRAVRARTLAPRRDRRRYRRRTRRDGRAAVRRSAHRRRRRHRRAGAARGSRTARRDRRAGRRRRTHERHAQSPPTASTRRSRSTASSRKPATILRSRSRAASA